jgi:hypothetical protein
MGRDYHASTHPDKPKFASSVMFDAKERDGLARAVKAAGRGEKRAL